MTETEASIRYMKRTLALVLLTAAPLTVTAYAAELYIFTVAPTIDIMATPGGLVGWRYSLSNQSSTKWLVTSGFNSDAFLYGLGSPLFDFPVLSPKSGVTEVFDPILQAGLYQFRWDTNAPDGWTNSGNFTLSAEWWTGDPGNGGVFIAPAADSVQSYATTVQVSTPEPATSLCILTGVVVLALIKRHYRLAKG